MYKFGVMSSKYELVCEDEIIAKVAMSLYLKTSAPIVIYYPNETAFKPTEILESNMGYCNEKKGELIKTMKSIRECKLIQKKGEKGR